MTGTNNCHSRRDRGAGELKQTCLAVAVCCVAGALAGGCGRNNGPGGGDATIRVGYVLHGLNEFTRVIQEGAEDAGKVEGIHVDVTGPAGFVATDALAMFEGMVQKKVGGLVVVPMPGEIWVTPIRQATQAGIPVITANVTSPGSTATCWFGQNEFASGVILATELRNQLAAQGVSQGKIVVGICAPGLSVLEERYRGLKQGMGGSEFEVTDPFDVNTENATNYGAWESLAGANSEMVAIVGLCSMDLPNLAKLKARTGGKWLVAGYDLGRETLDAVRAGTVQVVVGQHPYLQGYLPVVALARHLRDDAPLPQGWIDIGMEVVTKVNVDAIYDRETDANAQRDWYADYLAKHFADLKTMAKPLP